MKQAIKRLLNDMQRAALENDMQRAALEIGTTRSDTKAHKIARANKELTETALNTIFKELDQNYVKLALSGKRNSDEAKEILELKSAITKDAISEREEIGTNNATALKKKLTNAEMIAFRKAYRKEKSLYNPELEMLNHEGEKAVKALKYHHNNNTDKTEGAINDVENIIAELRNLHDGEADTLAMVIENAMREIVGESKFELTINTFNSETYLAESTEHRKFSNLTGAMEYDAKVKASGVLHTSELVCIECYYNKQREDISHDEFLKIYGDADEVVDDSEQAEETDAPFTAEETALLDNIEKSAFDNIVYRHGNHELAHQAAIDGDTANTELGKLAITARKNGDEEHFKLLFDEVQARINHAVAFAGKIESSAGQYIRGELTYKPLGNRSIVLEQSETRVGDGTNPQVDSAKPQTVNEKPVFSKIHYVYGIADAVSNLSSFKRRRWDIYTIKNAANLKGFTDVCDVAQRILDEGFDAFTVGDYLRLTA